MARGVLTELVSPKSASHLRQCEFRMPKSPDLGIMITKISSFPPCSELFLEWIFLKTKNTLLNVIHRGFPPSCLNKDILEKRFVTNPPVSCNMVSPTVIGRRFIPVRLSPFSPDRSLMSRSTQTE